MFRERAAACHSMEGWWLEVADVGAPSDKLMEVLRSGQYEIDIMRG